MIPSFRPEGFSEAALSQPQYQASVDRDVYVTMRDGVRVAVDIYRPDAPGPFPALYASSPYRKDLVYLPAIPAYHNRETNKIEWFVERGYVYVHADIRGAGKSEGVWKFHSLPEQTDHYDLVEWMAAQDWCTGKVGMIGESYYAWTQWFAAATQPPHLACIAPFDGACDMYRDVVYHGGLINMAFLTWWHFNLRANHLVDDPGAHSPDLMRWDLIYEALSHPTYDDFWRERSVDLAKIKCPVYSIGVWHKMNLHLRGNLRGFEEIRVPKKLLVVHGDKVGDEMAIFRSPEMRPELLRWYDHWLKDIDTGIMDDPPVRLFVRGSEEGYRAEGEWPLARTEYTRFYFGPGPSGAALSLNDGVLRKQAPGEDEGSFEFEYPREGWGGWLGQGTAGEVNGLLHPTSEILSFTSAPLDSDMEVTGPITAVLYVSSTETDTDFYVRVVDQEPDGVQQAGLPPKGRILTRGWLKGSHREVDPALSKSYRPFHTHTAPVPMVPGEVYRLEIEVLPTSNVFRQGHRIRIDVGNGDSPAFDGGGHHYGIKMGRDRIYHDRAHPSHIVLPVIPRA